MSTAADTEPPLLTIVRSYDKPDSSKIRDETRQAHLEWIISDASPEVYLGGPLFNSDKTTEGSLTLYPHHSPMAKVRKVIYEDPYEKAGLFETEETLASTLKVGSTCGKPLPENLFMVWCHDKQDTLQLRLDTRPKHLEWWKESGKKGFIGPFLNDNDNDSPIGTLILCEGDSIEDVTRWASTDPYAIAGVFDTVDVRGFQKVIEDGALV